VNAHEVNWVPWSEWISPPGEGRLLSMAIPSAFVARAAEGDVSIDHPTTLRENVSSTTAQYTLPSVVVCSVMSVTQSRFGSVRAKARSTRSSAVGASCLGRRRLLPGRPFRPARCMSITTAL